ncbi:MAG TPA: nucleoside triphosphate pyrophosphatase [Sphingomonadaceae bacterium]|nr:nucleoside triphosphate pyrophosphatase [Sphingomonadaceae bacterium]
MIVLASGSASRKAMLEAAGVPFEVIRPGIDERALEAELDDPDPMKACVALAEAKARAVSEALPGRLVLGGDSLVTVEGRRFDKPETRAQATDHLRFFSGRRMELHSAAVLVRDGERQWYNHASAGLLVRDLTDAFIEKYLQAEWPAVSGCVGVFRIEGRGVQLFTAIEGDQFTVLGMPLLAVLDALRDFGELPS